MLTRTPTSALPPTALPPRLGPWSRTWRYLLASALGLAAWFAVTADLVATALPDDVSDAAAAAVVGVLLLDLLLGLVALGLLALRRRRPVLVATATIALTVASASAVGAAALAAVSMSSWRRWPSIVGVGAAWVAATLGYELLYRPAVLPGVAPAGALLTGAAGVLALFVYAACAATGSYVGARRELLATLRERAVTAEREQVLKAEAAREAERTRIAREMHDVMAHRISLVAMHAGALAYRSDLSREQTASTAAVIQDNAHLALTELRQVLGVLRAGTAGEPEPPQPTLAELPALLADAREAGTAVDLDTSGLPDGDRSSLAGLSETASRTAFRIVQEALTNARKHAPDRPARLRLAGAPGQRLEVVARNAVAGEEAAGPPGAGMGLVGLAERAELAGGGLEQTTEDGEFVVRAWLPWR